MRKLNLQFTLTILDYYNINMESYQSTGDCPKAGSQVVVSTELNAYKRLHPHVAGSWLYSPTWSACAVYVEQYNSGHYIPREAYSIVNFVRGDVIHEGTIFTPTFGSFVSFHVQWRVHTTESKTQGISYTNEFPHGHNSSRLLYGKQWRHKLPVRVCGIA